MLKHFCNQPEWQQDKLVLVLLCIFLIFFDPVQVGEIGENNSDGEILQILC